jgi:general secretion pathway protein F
MGVYDMIRYNLVYIIGSLLSMVIFGVLVSKTKKGHYLFCKIVLALPLLGKILREAFVAMFCQTMATLLNAGVSVLEILDILLAMTKNDIIKDSIIRAREQIVEGSDLSSSFSISGFFPNMVVKMIRVGEESGSLSRVLDTTSRYYERKVDALISTVLSLLEPIMIIVVGGVVLTVVLALYLPIFSMSEVAR